MTNMTGKGTLLQRMTVLTVGVILLSSLQAGAGMLSKMNYMLHSWPREHRVKKLIVTGNYVKPRLLAELIQHETKYPILLASPRSEGHDLFFLPYGPKAMPLEGEDVAEFVDMVNPKQILMLGPSPRYIPQDIAEIMQNQRSCVRVNSSNWAKNAQTLADMFMYRKLPPQFADMYEEIRTASRSSEPSDFSDSSSVLAPLER